MLKGIFESLAIPPISFLYLAILGAAIGRRHRRMGRLIVGAGLAGLVILAIPVVSEATIVGLEQGLPLVPPPDKMPRAIVILGGDVTRTADEPFAVAGPLTMDRIRAGAALHRRTGLPILVTGGIVQRERLAVATIMAASLRQDFQVPAEWVEDASTDTWENAALSAAILKPKGITSVYVVTNAWHMRRALIAFRKAGLTATAAPTSFDIVYGQGVAGFLPRVSSWQWSFFAIHEWIGIAIYALR